MSNLKEQLMIYSCNDCDGDGIKYCPYKKEDSHDKYCQRPKTFAEDMLRIFEYNNYYPIRADSEGLVKIVSPCEICEYNCPQEKKGICVTYRDYTNKMQLLKAQKALCDKEKEEAVKKVGDKIRKFDKGEGWIELGEADLADIIKQTLEVSK